MLINEKFNRIDFQNGIILCIYFLFLLVPDSAPENITYKNISSGEVEISFHPPRSPNGIIQKYTIYLKRSNGNEERTIDTTSLIQNIKGKKIYTYIFIIFY